VPVTVSDPRSNPNDQIAHAAKVLGRSAQRLAVFKAIYHGKKRRKTVSALAGRTGLPRKRVLTEAKKLVNQHIVTQTRDGQETAYEKDPFYHANKGRIVALATYPAKLKQFPTKYSGKPAEPAIVKIRLPRQRIRIRHITVDDVDSFAKVRKTYGDTTPTPIPEARFKRGVQRILGEGGRFVDWGGERNDLLTTRVRIGGRRRPTAFAFKGPGRRGILTPGRMGKHGDQIQRLFTSPADVFFVQYWGQVADSVVEQLEQFAKAKSAGDGKEILFGIIDGQDSNRLIAAYPKAFKGH
jgi:hypothetical protein